MTEQEWIAGIDPQKMLEFLRGKASERKLRLFAVACCRRNWNLLLDERSRKAVAVAEEYADGRISEPEREAAEALAIEIANDYAEGRAEIEVDFPEQESAQAAALCVAKMVDAGDVIDALATAASGASDPDESLALHESECLAQSALLRELCGLLPFRPIVIASRWLTSPVNQLVEAIYRERAFDCLPILADALEEAGCHDADILHHCRQQWPHVRGCWVVDLILGKE